MDFKWRSPEQEWFEGLLPDWKREGWPSFEEWKEHKKFWVSAKLYIQNKSYLEKKVETNEVTYYGE